MQLHNVKDHSCIHTYNLVKDCSVNLSDSDCTLLQIACKQDK
eukprot:Gb_08216 [translate_table: standard]